MKKKCNEKFIYYLSWLTAIVVVLVILFEIATTFSLVESLYNSRILLYLVYYSTSLVIPLVLLSSILAFKINGTPYGKKSVKLLVNAGISYGVIKITLVIISSIKLFNSGVF